MKHNHELATGFSWTTDTLDINSKLPAFSKQVAKDETHEYDEAALSQKMEETWSLLVNTFNKLMEIIWPKQEDDKNETLKGKD